MSSSLRGDNNSITFWDAFMGFIWDNAYNLLGSMPEKFEILKSSYIFTGTKLVEIEPRQSTQCFEFACALFFKTIFY